MAKITKSTQSPRLSTPEVEEAGRIAEKATARRTTKKGTDEIIRNTWSTASVSPQVLGRPGAPRGATGTPTPSPVRDVAAAPPPNLSALDPQRGFLPVKVPSLDQLTGAAPITFGQTGAPTSGELKAGGRMVLSYDARRSPLQENLGNVPAWGVTAYVEFQPSGERIEAPAVAFTNTQGRISPEPQAVPIALDIPAGTTGVTVWFKQFQGASSPRTEWDSDYGRNYHFTVK